MQISWVSSVPWSWSPGFPSLQLLVACCPHPLAPWRFRAVIPTAVIPLRPHEASDWNHGLGKSFPMAARLRLVKYYNINNLPEIGGLKRECPGHSLIYLVNLRIFDFYSSVDIFLGLHPVLAHPDIYLDVNQLYFSTYGYMICSTSLQLHVSK